MNMGVIKRIFLALAAFILAFSLASCDEGDLTDAIQDVTGGNENVSLEDILDSAENAFQDKAGVVSFYSNGGSFIDSQTVYELKEAPKPTRDGFAFDGWYLDEGLREAAVFPIDVDNDMSLYASWFRLSGSASCEDGSIKWWVGSDSSLNYYITPSGFDIERLAREGYVMKITVTYNVRYEKDYDVLFDIGYAGAPKYEVYIINTEGGGAEMEDIKTGTDARRSEISYTVNAADMKNSRIRLKFSTNNIQNIIYFEDITVSYECYKVD